jgi:uncharacterized RDD family membrane protein YckC
MAEPLALGPHAARNRRSLVTPEGVDLMVLALIALTLVAIFSAVGFSASDGGEWALEFVGAVWLLGFFLIRNFYFILFEGGTRAATWGKRAFGLRVVARSGERLTSESVVARNLMREVELYLPLSYLIYALVETDSADSLLAWGGLLWVLVFTLFPLFNKDRLRVGDLLAGTWVVNIPKRNLSYDLVTHAPIETGQFSREQLDAYGVYEIQTLEQVLRDAQPDTLRLVAGTIREKIGYWGPGDDYEFLSAYYREARAVMERGLLFGKRRADKFDR